MTPEEALRSHRWCKLIVGASYHHVPAIRNLALVYGLAGVSCLDVAADPAIVRAALAGLDVAQRWGMPHRPWLMVSLNDGEDPHFRKAVFEGDRCPPDCAQPCRPVCPTQAIGWLQNGTGEWLGVTADLCYGCGRCLTVCPPQRIETVPQTYDPLALWRGPLGSEIQAIEIHTQPDRETAFAECWARLAPVIPQLRAVSVSFPDLPDLESALRARLAAMHPFPEHLIWQVDGRPMSGDIGRGTSHAAAKLGTRVLAMGLPGFVQLAGGTNDRTPQDLAAAPALAGAAFGGYGRTLVADLLARGGDHLETDAEAFTAAIARAKQLVTAVQGGTPPSPPQICYPA
ncbi:MAG TPA: 4Fe-4S ferredoxin [Cyanobacteria bacterium UBA8156]|nr:4Fe-4S ferredoxin [Cyanobacteria bacterium UBA8156]